MDLALARQLIAEFVEASKEFSLAGPNGFEDIVVKSEETDLRYFRQLEMTDNGLGNFGLLLYVYSQPLDENTVQSKKFRKLLDKSARIYEKQNVRLALDGNQFFLGVALLDNSTTLLRLLGSFAKLTEGVHLFEVHLNQKMGLNIKSKW